MDDVWISRSAMPERFNAATTRSISRLLPPSASDAVFPWLTTPAEKTARSGTRLLRPSADRLSSALVGLNGETWTVGAVCAAAVAVVNIRQAKTNRLLITTSADQCG